MQKEIAPVLVQRVIQLWIDNAFHLGVILLNLPSSSKLAI